MRLALEYEGRKEKDKSRADMVESRGTITSRPSQLDLDVPVSVHPAPDILGYCLAFVFHVDVVMAALMDSN